jgi:hypothetical protein
MSKRSHHRNSNTVNINELANALNRAGYQQQSGGTPNFPPGMGASPNNQSNPLGGLFGNGQGQGQGNIANSLGALTSLLGNQNGGMPNMGGVPGMGMPQMPVGGGMPPMPNMTPPYNNGAQQQKQPQQAQASTASTQQQTTDMEMLKKLFLEILQTLKEKE